MKTPRLESSGVVLRPLELADADALYAAHSDEETHHYWSSPAHKSVAQTRDYIADTLALPGAHVWAITESGGEALGRIGLFSERDGVGEIGIIMRREATGRGLASKALNLVVEHGFGPLGLHRIADQPLPARRLPARGLVARQLENPSRHSRQRHHGEAARLR